MTEENASLVADGIRDHDFILKFLVESITKNIGRDFQQLLGFG